MPHNPLPSKKDNTIPPPVHPFENIALAFSGGGFRAASFALGVLSYLHHVRVDHQHSLLKKVTYLTSASGGSIATAMYALNQAESGKFHEFYKSLFLGLEGTALLDDVFETLVKKSEWEARPDKRRNLINAFALAYDKKLFGGKLVGQLAHANCHIQEVCFNSTEFYRGLLFRQTVKMAKDEKGSADTGFLYGNFIVHLDHEMAHNLKIADLLAASSCFPAGFEPIIFPADFTHDKATRDQLLKKLTIVPQELSKKELGLLYGKKATEKLLASLPQNFTTQDVQKAAEALQLQPDLKFGMMDGGITDNQGLESMIRANERRIAGQTSFKPFDLMLVNDVGSHFMDPYQLDGKDKNNGITIKTVLVLTSVLLLAGLAGIWSDFQWGDHSLLYKILGIAGGIVATASLLTIGGILLARRFIKGQLHSGSGLNFAKNFSPEIAGLFFDYFGSAPLRVIIRMVKERVSSVLTLNNDVFLKRIRQLLYQRFFEAGKWKYRVKANHVYDLTFTNDTNRIANDGEFYKPSREMQIVAEEAFRMGTTLWFDKTNQQQLKQAHLIACGQFTTCYNLLLYTDCLEQDADIRDHAYLERLAHVKQQLLADFERFQQDPFWQYNHLGEHCVGDSFKPYKPGTMKLPEEFQGLR